ncbi:MAG TPA: sialidase family protein [Acidobacteriota bacterium]|nr:sialidase family protein [Acidobacteriota bacterium]
MLRWTVISAVSLLVALCGAFDSAHAQDTATDLPMWFDVSATPPPNIKLNTDNTFQLQNEESVAVDPTNPNNLVAVWRDFRLGYRQVGWGYSHDGGSTWTEGGLVPATPYNRDSDPVITVNNDGVFYGMILSYDEYSPANGLFVPISLDSGMTWPLYITAVDHPPEFPSDAFEDKEWIVCDQTGGPGDGNLYVPWTRFTDTTGIFCVSSTNGASFGDPRPVSDRRSVQWPVAAVGADGRVIVAWVSFTRSAILYDISYDQGWTWSTDRVLQATLFQDGDINGGIRTFGFPAMTSDMTQSPYRGRLYCVFEDRAADGLLDLYLTMSLDSGMTWTSRVRINDDPLGNHVDQFHPWIAVNPDGVVSAAFYDRRLDPANLLFDLWVTHSFDGGQTWTPNQRVSEVSSSPYDASALSKSTLPPQPYDRNAPISLLSPQAGLIGEYIGIATSRLRATMVFTDTRNGNQDVYAANMPLRLFPPRLIGPADGLEVSDAEVLFEWDDYSFYDSDLTYTLEYSPDTAFASDVVRVSGLTAHTENVTLAAAGVCYWRVRATDPLGDSSVFSVPYSVEYVPTCVCECHGDPAECEGVINVLDVVSIVGVAFRGAPEIPDPNVQCPYTTTDLDCSGYTNVIDVVKIVNVAFRGGIVEVEFCDPCP